VIDAAATAQVFVAYAGMWSLGYLMAKGIAYVRKIVSLA
jgi:hypothetical protein